MDEEDRQFYRWYGPWTPLTPPEVAVCVWSNASGTLRPLKQPDDLLEDCRQLWVRRDEGSQWLADLAMTPHDGDTWISPRDETIRFPTSDAVFTSPDGIHYLRPEIVLAFKARRVQRSDDADFDAVVPLLDGGRRDWLRSAIVRVDPEHPWLERIRM